MTVRLRISWCLFMLFAAFLPAATAQVSPFTFSHFTLDNNLYAHTLIRDSKGYLWVGSDGLYRYDGVSIKRFIHNPKNNNSLVSNIVKSIAEDKKGRIWVGTMKGISCYNPATDSFANYEYDSENKEHSQQQLDNILYIDDDNTVWSGDKAGINRYDEATNKFIPYNLQKYQLPGRKKGSFVTHIIQDKENKDWLWLGSYDGFIHFNKKTGFAKYYYPLNEPLTINGMLEDSRGRLWLSTWGKGLALFNPVNGSFSFFLFEKDRHFGSDNIVFNIEEDSVSKDSSLFFVSTDKGLALLNLLKPGKVRFDSFLNHLPDDSKSIGGLALKTIIDKQGIIWIATGNDVSYILPAAQLFRNVNIGPAVSIINTITEEKLPNGHYQYWLSGWYTDGPIVCDEHFVPKKKVVLPEGYGLAVNSRQINQVYPDSASGSLWLATMDGIYHWDRRKHKVKPFLPDSADAASLPSEQVMCILMDHQKRMWAGTYSKGICLLNTLTGTFIKLPEQLRRAISNQRVFCMYEDSRRRIWIGCTTSLVRINENDGGWKVYHHQRNNLRSKADGNVNGITEDKNGIVWIGNDEGLNRYNEATDDFDLFTTADGLSNDHIYSLAFDNAGMLWVGSPTGLNLFDPSTKKIKNFYQRDGLFSNDVSNALLFVAHTNEIAVAVGGGYVALFNPHNLYMNTVPPPVYINSLTLFNKSDNRQSYFPLPREVNLTYDQNYFSIDFIALNLMNATDNKYAYQLTGLDKRWIQSGSDHSVTYSSLSPGKYTFKVKASNNDGVWNEQGASLIINISPPFWKTWWFIIICVLLTLAVIYILYNYRLEQLLRVERLRTKISTDLHDDIGSTLSSISILSELVLNRREEKQAKEMLHEIKDNALNLMEKMDDIVWSINPKNDSLEDLLSRITRFAGQLFEARDIDHRITIQPHIRELKLSMEARQHLYLMLKETINNIIKHARCSSASVSVTHKDGVLTVVIEDNGIGFDTRKPGTGDGNGLINLRDRAAKMGAVVDIHSAAGEGTVVTISVKIK